jgi:hypothetical protein
MVVDAIGPTTPGNQDPIGRRINLTITVAVRDRGRGRARQAMGSRETQKKSPGSTLPSLQGVSDDNLAGTTGVGWWFVPGEIKNLRSSPASSGGTSQSSQNVVANAQTMNEVIADSLAQRRFSMILLGSFAAVALLLSSLGIYGVISYLVGQRTHELGIRMALGAKRTDIFRLVLGHGLKMTIAGVAIGLLAAFGLTRLMTKMIFGVSATDPVTFAVIALLLILVALLACFVPARRATKVDPLVALRYE